MTIRATLLPCDAAQVDSDGRLYLLGAGAQAMPLPTPPFTVLVRLRLTADEALRPHEVRVGLLDPSGLPVLVQTAAPAGTGPASVPGTVMAQPLQLGQDLPALTDNAQELPDWGPIVVPLLFNLGPGLPVRAGAHRWVLTVDGVELDDAVVLLLDQTAQG